MYYMCECENLNSFKECEQLRAKTLKSAKIEASKKQVFSGTILKIGTSVNRNGFLINDSIICYKEDNKWNEYKWNKYNGY